MECQNCHELVEEGAAYCGNCGQATRTTVHDLGATGMHGAAPSYATALPIQRAGETQAMMSVLFGAAGLAGALVVPVIGLGLGLAGIVMGTVSRIYGKKSLRLAGVTLSSIAILAGLATWAQAVRNDPRINPDVARVEPASSSAQVSANLSTPCYSLNFVDELNISQAEGSCNMSAFNGKTIAASTNAYRVYAAKAQFSSVNDFNNKAKSATQKDMAKSAPSFKVNGQHFTTFAGSPAFVLSAFDEVHDVSLTEAIVWHDDSADDNTFILVHANNGDSADLQIMESQWQWK